MEAVNVNKTIPIWIEVRKAFSIIDPLVQQLVAKEMQETTFWMHSICDALMELR